jgi:multidrug resistance efflux pump
MSTIVRNCLRAAIVALVLGGGYCGWYLWPAGDTRTIQTVGIIEAPEVNITSRIAGRIVQLDLLEGDTVERGQVVCTIRSASFRTFRRIAQNPRVCSAF